MPGSLAGGSVAKVAKLSVVKVEIVRPSLLKPSANEDFPKDQKPRCQIGAFYISVDSHPCSAQTSFESPFLKRVRSFRECRMYRPPLSRPPSSCRHKSFPHRPLPGYSRGAHCRPPESRQSCFRLVFRLTRSHRPTLIGGYCWY